MFHCGVENQTLRNGLHQLDRTASCAGFGRWVLSRKGGKGMQNRDQHEKEWDREEEGK